MYILFIPIELNIAVSSPHEIKKESPERSTLIYPVAIQAKINEVCYKPIIYYYFKFELTFYVSLNLLLFSSTICMTIERYVKHIASEYNIGNIVYKGPI